MIRLCNNCEINYIKTLECPCCLRDDSNILINTSFDMNNLKNNSEYIYGEPLKNINQSFLNNRIVENIFIKFYFENDLLYINYLNRCKKNSLNNYQIQNTNIHRRLINRNEFILFPTIEYLSFKFVYVIMLLNDFKNLDFIQKLNLDKIIIKQPLIYKNNRLINYDPYINMSTFYQIKLDFDLFMFIGEKYKRYQMKQKYK